MISHLKYYCHFCYLLFQGKGASNSFLPGIKTWLCVSCSLVGSFLSERRVTWGDRHSLHFLTIWYVFFFFYWPHMLSVRLISKQLQLKMPRTATCLWQPLTPWKTTHCLLTWLPSKPRTLLWFGSCTHLPGLLKNTLEKETHMLNIRFLLSCFRNHFELFWNVKNAGFLEPKQYVLTVEN